METNHIRYEFVEGEGYEDFIQAGNKTYQEGIDIRKANMAILIGIDLFLKVKWNFEFEAFFY